jgi:hypothetical protein
MAGGRGKEGGRATQYFVGFAEGRFDGIQGDTAYDEQRHFSFEEFNCLLRT